jgi:hypothetical protein
LARLAHTFRSAICIAAIVIFWFNHRTARKWLLRSLENVEIGRRCILFPSILIDPVRICSVGRRYHQKWMRLDPL